MTRILLVVAVLGTAGISRAQAVKWLPTTQVFPTDGPASAQTLDVPLVDRIAQFRADHHKRGFAKRIVIFKSRRRMDVYADDTLLKSYIVNLGPEPEGAKQLQGDGRTPEGDLYICSVNRTSQFTRFLALAYPSPEDAARGESSGLVDATQAKAIVQAWRTRRSCPPQTTRLGGQVGGAPPADCRPEVVLVWQHRGELAEWISAGVDRAAGEPLLQLGADHPLAELFPGARGELSGARRGVAAGALSIAARPALARRGDRRHLHPRGRRLPRAQPGALSRAHSRSRDRRPPARCSPRG